MKKGVQAFYFYGENLKFSLVILTLNIDLFLENSIFVICLFSMPSYIFFSGSIQMVSGTLRNIFYNFKTIPYTSLSKLISLKQ